MDDICERLRSEVVFEPEVGELLADAANEIERLRESADKRGTIAVDRRREIERLRLTDAERDAIEWALNTNDDPENYEANALALRGLLERHIAARPAGPH